MKKIIVFLGIWACYCLPINSYAQKQHLTFSTFELGFFNEVNARLFTEVYQRLGIEINIINYPAERAVVLANSGITDGELSRKAIVAKLYPNLLRIPTAYAETKTAIFAKKKHFPVDLKDKSKKYRIAILRGYKIAEYLTQNFRVETIATPKRLFYFLERDRAELVMYSQEAGLAYLKALEMNDIAIVMPPVENEPVYHFLHKKHAALVPEVNRVINQVVKEGLPEKIRQDVLMRLIVKPE
jgi:polar amino acid transport system substrate-binding protein